MAIELKIPDMGEDIADVTISRWLKQEGDDVQEGEIVLEIATDKVDTEVVSTANGTLLKIHFGEGELVDVNTTVALIGEAGESIASDNANTATAVPPHEETHLEAPPVEMSAGAPDVTPGSSGDANLIEVTLPDAGEGIEDVTISRWFKQVGDSVTAGEPLLEVATDKVDSEIPAPASGTLLEINFGEGALAEIGAVVARIGGEGASIPAPSAAVASQSEAAVPPTMPAISAMQDEDLRASPVAKRIAAAQGIQLGNVAGTGPGGRITKEDVLASADGSDTQQAASTGLTGEFANVASLSVRRVASIHGVDLDELAAGKPLSTLTRYDVLRAVGKVDEQFLAPADWSQPSPVQPVPATAPVPTPSASAAQAAPRKPAAVSPAPIGPSEELVKPNRMRQIIAKNMMESLQNSAQLTTWHDVDMSAVLAHRKAHKKEFAAQGVNLTVTAYLVAATVAGLQAVPASNAAWTDEGILIKRDYNVGMAVSLPADQYGMGGLIVPVIKNAGDLNLLGIARQVNELAEKARDNKLTPSDLQGGTFTLTNYGTSGSRFQTPILNGGQAGILGTGATEKRAVVVSNGHPLEANTGDYLTFKPMMTLALTFDHRVLDGASADTFCIAVKNRLEGWG